MVCMYSKVSEQSCSKIPLINFGSIHLKHFWVVEPLKSLIETMDILKNICTFFSFQYFLYLSKSLAPTPM